MSCNVHTHWRDSLGRDVKIEVGQWSPLIFHEARRSRGIELLLHLTRYICQGAFHFAPAHTHLSSRPFLYIISDGPSSIMTLCYYI